MPIHNYWCDLCKTKKRRRSNFADVQQFIECPNCGQLMHKILEAPAIQFRGSGFSKTDVKKPYDPFDKDDLDKGMERTVK